MRKKQFEEEEEEERAMLTVKPNWIGPKATIITQATTEMELSRMTWDEPIILDCLEPMRYQLPVCRKGFLRSLPSSLSSLKLIVASAIRETEKQIKFTACKTPHREEKTENKMEPIRLLYDCCLQSSVYRVLHCWPISPAPHLAVTNRFVL